MEERGYEETLKKIVNPETMVADMPNDKIWLLIGQAEDIASDYEREVAISYLSCNHSEIKHLCTTYLRGKTDEFIIEKLKYVKEAMNKEMERRRRERGSLI